MYMATWQCLIHGRPPLLTQRHIDIQLPEEETEETMGTDPRCSYIFLKRWYFIFLLANHVFLCQPIYGDTGGRKSWDG